MRRMTIRGLVGALGGLALSGCQADRSVGVTPLLNPPQHLQYQVEVSGTPGHPAGIVLHWDRDSDPNLQAWNVYSRSDSTRAFALRAQTTSNSFHDEGEPQLQYVVTAVDISGGESDPSNVVTVDERLALHAPSSLTSVSLDSAIALLWTDNSYTADPGGFGYYRVYSAPFDLDHNQCGSWSWEGTTVAPEFRSAALANGVPLCFAVSAVSMEGFESLWSPIRSDTPRPDARNVALTARQIDNATAGFRFWRDLNGDGKVQSGELGRIGAGTATDVDFSLERDPTGRLLLTPVRPGTSVTTYGTQAVGDLTDIDVAPTGGYSRSSMEARPGWGFVFQMDGGDGFARYGAVRVTHVGPSLIIFDWSFQTDPGNPELSITR